MDDRRAEHLMGIGDRPVAVHLLQTGRTVDRLGGEIARAIERQEIAVIHEPHRFERVAALDLSDDALEDWAERLGGNRIQDLAHVRVTRDALDTIERA
jgi:hypothetical protein